MDNENKVTDLVARSKLLFLREVIDEFRKKQARYDLGKEFAKTKKNRSIVVPGIVLLVTVAFAIGALSVTFYIQESSRRIQVSIEEFEDVNLKEVLDAAKKNENDMRRARSELAGIETVRDAELAAIRAETSRRIDIITAEGHAEAERNRRINAERPRENQRLAGVNAAYAPRIEAKQREIADIQARIDSYDTRLLAQARDQEAILNNQQRLFNIELERTTQGYESRIKNLEADRAREVASLKAHQDNLVRVLRTNHANEIAALILRYNPNITDAAIQALLGERIDTAVLRARLPGPFKAVLETENIVSRAELAELERQVRDFDRLVGELKKIPYRNSVPPVLAQLEYRQRAIAAAYERIWNRLADAAAAKNQTIANQRREIESFAYALDQLVRTNRENGYVIDARDPNSILVYIDPLRVAGDGMDALVFRRDDEFIGRIRLSRRDGRLRAVLVELVAADKPLQPFDKVLIKEKQE